ncbi:MAG: beta-galactosidase [Planctomycetes bacterium]|nr:beta-galactosidase [Planctomycetota bacterium]
MIGKRIGVLLLLAASLAAQQSTPRAPERFERILWTSDLPAVAPRAAALGFTSVQIGRGVDPAPAVANGLGYYLDQPVGKGVLELREGEFTPLRLAYEKTRDPAVLVRPGCLATPGLVDELARAAAAEAVRVAGPGLRFVALADEPSATRHDAPLDTCWCEHCMDAFRRWARARYATIDAVNTAFGTQFESFDTACPLSTDQVRRRELGDTFLPRDLRAFAARLDFVDQQYATALRKIASAVGAAVPGVPIGVTGTSAPAAFGGGDPFRWLPSLTMAEPYPVGGAAELAASLLPAGAHRYATLFPPSAEGAAATVGLTDLVRATLADLAAHGAAGVVVWNDSNVFGPEAEPSPFGRAVRDGLRRLAVELDACAGATIEPGPIWIVESQASVRAWWMIDSAKDGMTWVRRLASYEAEHSTSQAARRSWIALLRDLGFQPFFVAESMLAERLPVAPPRCLVLPAAIALGDRALQAITSYARAGGTVLADHTPALYDAELSLRERGGLDDLFGITQRSLRWQDLLVREGRHLGSDLPQVERGLGAKLAERHREGDMFAENDLDRGSAVYLNAAVCEYARLRLDTARVEQARQLRRRVRSVLRRARCLEPCDVRGQGLPTCVERVSLRLRDGRRVLAIRLAALDDPKLLAMLAQDGPRQIRVELPQVRTLRLLGGPALGTGREFDLPLDPFGALFLEDEGR